MTSDSELFEDVKLINFSKLIECITQKISHKKWNYRDAHIKK